jgi:hypothetical protein
MAFLLSFFYVFKLPNYRSNCQTHYQITKLKKYLIIFIVSYFVRAYFCGVNVRA